VVAHCSLLSPRRGAPSRGLAGGTDCLTPDLFKQLPAGLILSKLGKVGGEPMSSDDQIGGNGFERGNFRKNKWAVLERADFLPVLAREAANT